MGLGAYMLVWLAAACPWAAMAPTAVETAQVLDPGVYVAAEMIYGITAGSSIGFALMSGADCQVYLRAPPLAETVCHELRHCVDGAFHG